MSDWGTKSEKGRDLHAGNDVIMGGYRAEKLLDMMVEKKPEFLADGAVEEIVKSSHFGMVKSYLSKWGSFMPHADGKDKVVTTVAAGVELNKKVKEMVEAGIATVTENTDGSKTVSYHGTNRGAYLCLGDLQNCAIRILKGLMNSAAMDNLLKCCGGK